jgi:hypothetical protein
MDYVETMSDMVKYRAVSFKKDQIAALFFTMSDIVHKNGLLSLMVRAFLGLSK